MEVFHRNMGPAHSRREREEKKRRLEGKQAGLNPAPGTMALLATKLKDRYNSPHFIHEKVKGILSHAHALTFFLSLFLTLSETPIFTQSFQLQVSLNYSWIGFQILGDPLVRGIPGNIAPI